VTEINASGNTLIYSTYLGGSEYDDAWSVAVDPARNAYVTGFTVSDDFPIVNGLQTKRGGGEDVFVSKIHAGGNSLTYSTYLGGSGDDNGSGISVDSSGNAYVTGTTASSDFPTANAIQPALHGSRDAFVTKLNPAGNAFVYSTYLGGSADEFGIGIALDVSGNAFIAGGTGSTDFPTVNPLQASLHGIENGFVTKINAGGNALVYSTYLGGSGQDGFVGVRVDPAGNAHVTGGTDSADFPTLNAIQSKNRGGQEAVVAELNASGSALVYSTYLGGKMNEFGQGLAVDAAGSTYVTVFAVSKNFPTTPLGFQLSWPGRITSAVAKLAEQTFVKLPTGVALGEYVVGATSPPKVFFLRNNGTSALTINKIYLAGANPGDFAQSNTCGSSVAAGTKCAISITFTPLATGARKALLGISDSDPASPHVVKLRGIGI
jgi:hypothetical protein